MSVLLGMKFSIRSQWIKPFLFQFINNRCLVYQIGNSVTRKNLSAIFFIQKISSLIVLYFQVYY